MFKLVCYTATSYTTDATGGWAESENQRGRSEGAESEGKNKRVRVGGMKSEGAESEGEIQRGPSRRSIYGGGEVGGG